MSFASDLYPFRRNTSRGLLRPWTHQDNYHAARSPTLSELMSTESDSASEHTIVITAPLVIARPVPTSNSDDNPVNLPPSSDPDSVAYGIKCWAITTFWSFVTIVGFYFFSLNRIKGDDSSPPH
jgi:hypothetical protein